MIAAAAGPFRAEAADADTIAAINASSNALDKAFGERDIETIRALMTPDHVTVTPYYDGPQSVDDQIASLRTSTTGPPGRSERHAPWARRGAADIRRRPEGQLQGQAPAARIRQ